ncbi:MAG: hypothetical protein KAT79_01690 [candidate division Zixibacteria bacterium]|nr:hypothetical protein [candidate division Zixibacteria bacterium]
MQNGMPESADNMTNLTTYKRVLSEDDIAYYLPIYKQKYILFSQVILNRDGCTATLQSFDYPFTTVNIDYLPVPYASLLLCQIGYLAGAGIVESGIISDIAISKYLDLMMREQIVITDFRIRFKKFIPNVDGILFSANFTKVRNWRGRIICTFEVKKDEHMFANANLLINTEGGLRHNFYRS